MDFKHLSVLALFCMTLVGTYASQSEEEYWQSIWPNTPLPKALLDLSLPYSGTNVPIKAEEEKQYWTVFFEHDLYPGKHMSFGLHKHSDIHHSKTTVRPFGKPSQPFGTRAWWKNSVKTEKDSKPSQPFGTRAWWKNPVNTERDGKPKQPFGTRAWWKNSVKTEKDSKPSQPFGTRAWWKNSVKTERDSKPSQPFGTRAWWKNSATTEKDSKPSQPFGTRAWWKNAIKTERDELNDYCGSPAAVGEDKYCAPSLESMIDLVISKLGTTKIKVISSSFAQNQDQYAVEEVKRVGDKAVMCHRLNFEKVVFYCHQVNATTLYMVPLVASDGTKAKAVAVCHHDTRGMNADVLHDVLKVKPGTVPVCHFIGNKAVAWVPGHSNDHSC